MYHWLLVTLDPDVYFARAAERREHGLVARLRQAASEAIAKWGDRAHRQPAGAPQAGVAAQPRAATLAAVEAESRTPAAANENRAATAA